MTYHIKTLFFFAIMFVGLQNRQAQAQEVIATNDDDYFARNSVFVELGGNGLFYTLNYDHKFFNHASARIGVEYTSASISNNVTDDRVPVLLIPLMVNYLVGNGNSRLELGVGVVASGTNGDVRDEVVDNVIGGAFTGTVGYRLQPRDGGFLFRIGFTPIFTAGLFQPWAGLSLGATF